MFPDFIIAGAPKSGSTSLFELLKLHPETCMSKKKEPYFYLNDWGKSPQYYQKKYFPFCRGDKLVGEASIDYLYYPKVADRIFSVRPDTKFIFIFRNPVDRAFSHYWQDVKDGNEKASWESMVKNQLQANVFQYSFYHRSLRNFFKSEEPFKNTHIVVFEDLIQDTQGEIDKVCDFLSIKRLHLETTVLYNKGITYRSNKLRAFYLRATRSNILNNLPSAFLRPIAKAILILLNKKNSKPMAYKKAELEKVRPLLKRYYLKDIERLEGLLHRKLPWR